MSSEWWQARRTWWDIPSPSPEPSSAVLDSHQAFAVNATTIAIIIITAAVFIAAWKLGFFDDQDKGNWK